MVGEFASRQTLTADTVDVIRWWAQRMTTCCHSHTCEINIGEYSPPVYFHSMQAKGQIKHLLLMEKEIRIFTSCEVQLW